MKQSTVILNRTHYNIGGLLYLRSNNYYSQIDIFQVIKIKIVFYMIIYEYQFEYI